MLTTGQEICHLIIHSRHPPNIIQVSQLGCITSFLDLTPSIGRNKRKFETILTYVRCICMSLGTRQSYEQWKSVKYKRNWTRKKDLDGDYLGGKFDELLHLNNGQSDSTIQHKFVLKGLHGHLGFFCCSESHSSVSSRFSIRSESSDDAFFIDVVTAKEIQNIRNDGLVWDVWQGYDTSRCSKVSFIVPMSYTNYQSKSSIRAFLNSSSCDTEMFSKVSNLSSTDIEFPFTTVSGWSATSDAGGCDRYFIKLHRKDEQIRDTGGSVDEGVSISYKIVR